MILQIVKEMNWKTIRYNWKIKVYDNSKHYPHCIYERIIKEYGSKYRALYNVIADLMDAGIAIKCSDYQAQYPLESPQSNALIELEHYNMIKKGLDGNSNG